MESRFVFFFVAQVAPSFSRSLVKTSQVESTEGPRVDFLQTCLVKYRCRDDDDDDDDDDDVFLGWKHLRFTHVVFFGEVPAKFRRSVLWLKLEGLCILYYKYGQVRFTETYLFVVFLLTLLDCFRVRKSPRHMFSSESKEMEGHKGPSAQNSPRPQRKGTNTSFLGPQNAR